MKKGEQKGKKQMRLIFKDVKLICSSCCYSRYSVCLMHFRYTGSYNYGSYGNQHPPPMQSQYPALPHEAAISGPLHYAPYHRSSAQVSGGPACLPGPGPVNGTQIISTFCILCVQPVHHRGKDGLSLSVTWALGAARSGCQPRSRSTFSLTRGANSCL